MSDQNANERELRADTDTEVPRFSSVHCIHTTRSVQRQTLGARTEPPQTRARPDVRLGAGEFGPSHRLGRLSEQNRIRRARPKQEQRNKSYAGGVATAGVAAFMERGDSLSNRVAQASAASRSERLWWVGARDGRVWKLPRAWLTRRRIAKVREARSPEVDVSPAGVKAAAFNAAA
jgi:hypothetical protein